MTRNVHIVYLVGVSIGIGSALGCAATVPRELESARLSYERAEAGQASNVAPAELHVARTALDKAEASFESDPQSYRTRDLSYVAQRRAELAEARAAIILEGRGRDRADAEYVDAQGRIVERTKSDLTDAQRALAESERNAGATEQSLAAEQQARLAADKRAADAMAALAKMAAVKEEPRGLVITLSGSVLFASNQSNLLPDAQSKLNEVAQVLLSTKERKIVVEGHTDSQGSDSSNQLLSQRRADAVRSFLVSAGYGADLITADGRGEGQPIADNQSAEGRANNRRVEIVIQRPPLASN